MPSTTGIIPPSYHSTSARTGASPTHQPSIKSKIWDAAHATGSTNYDPNLTTAVVHKRNRSSMTTGAVFVLGSDRSLEEFQSTPFLRESDLQSMLAKHPKLLAGEQINSEVPRKWILVKREQVIPSSDKTDPASWRVDHLFLDQDGIPTLVEVKRQGNSDLRRKVVGQMLDYAANFATYWDARDLRSLFESSQRMIRRACSLN